MLLTPKLITGHDPEPLQLVLVYDSLL